MAAAAAAFAGLAVAGAASLRVLKTRRKLRRLSSHVLLVVDVGSSSVRCSVLHVDGMRKLLPGCSFRVKKDIVREGIADAEEIRGYVEECIDKCLSALRAEYPDGFDVLAVGFASFVMNLVAVDKVGAAVTPVLTYARQSPELAALATQLREDPRLEKIHQRVGTVIHSSYANVQLAHFYKRHTQPADDVTWQTVASYLIAKWTGRVCAPISTSEASWTGLLNARAATWDSVVADICGIPTYHLPALVDVGEYVSEQLKADYQRRWPELQTARFHFGLGDGAAANLGSLCDQFGRVAVTIGTSAAARVIIPVAAARADSFTIPKGLWCYRVDSERLLLGGALTDGGSAVAWFRDTYRVSDAEFAEMERAIELQLRTQQRPKVFALTLFSGERSPGWIDGATASFHGVTRSTTRTDLLRAIMEGVCFRLKEILLRIESGVHQASEEDSPAEGANLRLVVSGGALEQSKLWRVMLCQVAAKPVFVVRAAAELTSFGVGKLLLSHINPGKRSDSVEEGQIVEDVNLFVDSEPEPGMVAMYDAAFTHHRSLYLQSWDHTSDTARPRY